MRPREFFGKADRLQRSRGFKIVATCVVAALAVAAFATFVLASHRHGPVFSIQQPAEADAAAASRPPAGDAAAAPGSGVMAIDPEAAAGEAAQAKAQAKLEQDVARKTVDVLNGIMAAKEDRTSAAVGIGLLAGLMIGVVWLGLALTYVGLALGTLVLVLLARVFHLGEGAGPLIVGVAALTASFAALMRLAGLALSAPLPWLAIARNVLDEAVRMKISLVFIVLIIFGLAALPGLLDKEAFLRYRVQSFLQYGTGGSFWLIAILVLTFSASSVAFEQRDKVIWQTMTKPVAAWQYILGKWLGVVTLAAVLLAVSATGVFLFTEYLRNQPATGEARAYVSETEGDISEDRFLLETQVLAARERRQPDSYPMDEIKLAETVEQRVQQTMTQMRDNGESEEVVRSKEQAIRDEFKKALPMAVQLAYMRVPPGGGQNYQFSGLEAVRDSSSPLMLKFKVQAGSNAPDQLYKLTVGVQNEAPRMLETPLNQTVSLRPPLLPTAIDADGVLRLSVLNADYSKTPPQPNAEAISFPPDGMELSYSVGGYRMNFVRCIGALWVKLAFLSMLAICASTFLSFPVACLVAFATFLAAEGATFILEALEGFETETREGKTMLFNTGVGHIASVVGHIFKTYADLQPATRLVEGLRLSWTQVGLGTGALGTATAVLYAVATLIFRKRELATYSGN